MESSPTMLDFLINIYASIQKHHYRIEISCSYSANKCSICPIVIAQNISSFFIRRNV